MAVKMLYMAVCILVLLRLDLDALQIPEEWIQPLKRTLRRSLWFENEKLKTSKHSRCEDMARTSRLRVHVK